MKLLVPILAAFISAMFLGVGFSTTTLSVVISPSSSNVISGNSTTFSATVSGGSGSYYYEWFLYQNLSTYHTAFNCATYPIPSGCASDVLSTQSTLTVVPPVPTPSDGLGDNYLAVVFDQNSNTMGSATAYANVIIPSPSVNYYTLSIITSGQVEITPHGYSTGKILSSGNYTFAAGNYTITAIAPSGYSNFYQWNTNSSKIIISNFSSSTTQLNLSSSIKLIPMWYGNNPVIINTFAKNPFTKTTARNITIVLGQSVTLHANATGGDGNYVYYWQQNLPNITILNNGHPTNSSNFTVTPSTTGTFEYFAQAMDIDLNLPAIYSPSYVTVVTPKIYSCNSVVGLIAGQGIVCDNVTAVVENILPEPSIYYSAFVYLTGLSTNNQGLTSESYTGLPGTSVNFINQTGKTVTLSINQTYPSCINQQCPIAYISLKTNSTPSSTISYNSVYVGHNLTSGPWTVVLNYLNQQNSNGSFPASFSAYYKGKFEGNITVNVGTSAAWSLNATNGLYLYLSQTFSGLYSYQKWARFYIAAYNTSSKKIAFVGQQIIFPYIAGQQAGPWTIRLQSIGEPNSAGISPAEFMVYYNGTLVDTPIVNVNGATTVKYIGHSISINVLQTFDGLYAYQQWAGFNIVNGTDLYMGNSTTYGLWKVMLNFLSGPNTQGVAGANFSFYYGGVFINSTTIVPGGSATITYGDSGIKLTLYNTFDGLYASQKWAQFLLSPSTIIKSTTNTTFTNTTSTTTISTTTTSTTTISTTTIPKTIISRISSKNITINIKPGWNLLSVPFGPQSNESLNNIYNVYYELEYSCGMVPSSYSKTIWFYSNSNKTYIWPNNNGLFDNFVSTGMFNLVSGVVLDKDFGFWFYSIKPCQIVAPTFLSSTLQAYNQSYYENLSAGWNIVGVPFITNSSFKSIANSCSIRGAFYGYNTTINSYYNATTPVAGKSYFIYVNAPCTLDWTPNTASSSPPSIP